MDPETITVFDVVDAELRRRGIAFVCDRAVGRYTLPRHGTSFSLDRRIGRGTFEVRDLVDRLVAACDRVAEVDVGRWASVRDRLVVGVIEVSSAGALAWPAPFGAGLVFDVAIDLQPATVSVTGDLIDRWAVGLDHVRAVAVANTSARSRRAITASVDGATVTVWSGDRWTSGLAAEPGPAIARLRWPHEIAPRFLAVVDRRTVIGIGGCDRSTATQLAASWFVLEPDAFPPNLTAVDDGR